MDNMREIKFRAWDYKRKKMAIDVLDCFQFDNEFFPNHSKDVLMQYTGLNDKNGTEIYEGDIVRAASEGEWRIGEIAWGMAGFFIRLKTAPNIWYLSKGHNGEDMHCEIIGNIYENPELLNGTK